MLSCYCANCHQATSFETFGGLPSLAAGLVEAALMALSQAVLAQEDGEGMLCFIIASVGRWLGATVA